MPSSKKSTRDRALLSRKTCGGKTVHDVRLRINGKLKIVGSGFTTKQDARDHRDRVRLEIRDGVYDPAKYRRRLRNQVTVPKLMELVTADYRRHDRKTLHTAQGLARFWINHAGDTAAVEITGTVLTAWADLWLSKGSTAATINRRMAFLQRGYRLACEADPPLLVVTPPWHRLKESAPRSGFMEWPVYEQLRQAFPAYAGIPLAIGFWTGMRYGEIRSLKRPEQVTFDHAAKTVQLQLAGLQTKTGKPRTGLWPGDLYETLWAWEQSTQAQYPDCPWVCHRNGRALGTIDTIWKATCIKLGLATGEARTVKKPTTEGGCSTYYANYQGPIFHDLRRTGVRNLIRAGVDRETAKVISGHLTDSIFNRYNIVNEEDLAKAGAKVVDYLAQKENGSIRKSV